MFGLKIFTATFSPDIKVASYTWATDAAATGLSLKFKKTWSNFNPIFSSIISIAFLVENGSSLSCK